MKNERIIKNIIVAILVFITFWFGVRPVITGTSFERYLKSKRRDLDFDKNEYATIVIGSEPEGVASALASARTGLKTLLITRDSHLGSYIKTGMISKMNPQRGTINNKKVNLNRGIYEELFGKLSVGFSSTDYETQVRKLVENEKSLDVIYNSYITEVIVENQRVQAIEVQQKDGKYLYKARNFIDATLNGDLLTHCYTPYVDGSEDVGLPGFYEPVEFNFRISGVDTQALKKSQKTTDFIDEFQLAILSYKNENPRTKILSPSFIILNDSELVITGLQVYGVDVDDENDLKNAYLEAENEAIMLTSFLKNVVVAFKDCTYKEGPEEFFIPEYRHYKGRYLLTVKDIIENRDFKDKIALCSEAVDAGKFVDKNIEYIVAKPNVYSIPFGSIIPSNLSNVLMTGAKASYSSLAATSAANIPTRITVGEAAGLISAYSFLNDVSPVEIMESSDNDLEHLIEYLSRGGIYLEDFSEDILIPDTEEKLTEHQAYPYIALLAEYGLIAGGHENNFMLDSKASEEVFAILLKNIMLKMVPDLYTMETEQALKSYETKDVLTGEKAGEIILAALFKNWEEGKALETLKEHKVLPDSIVNNLKPNRPVTMDIVYELAVETAKIMKTQ